MICFSGMVYFSRLVVTFGHVLMITNAFYKAYINFLQPFLAPSENPESFLVFRFATEW